jgi:hypothetical protein
MRSIISEEVLWLLFGVGLLPGAYPCSVRGRWVLSGEREPCVSNFIGSSL